MKVQYEITNAIAILVYIPACLEQNQGKRHSVALSQSAVLYGASVCSNSTQSGAQI